MKEKFGFPVTMQCGKMQTVTIRDCAIFSVAIETEICVVPNAVRCSSWLFVEFILCVKWVGATSSETTG